MFMCLCLRGLFRSFCSTYVLTVPPALVYVRPPTLPSILTHSVIEALIEAGDPSPQVSFSAYVDQGISTASSLGSGEDIEAGSLETKRLCMLVVTQVAVATMAESMEDRDSYSVLSFLHIGDLTSITVASNSSHAFVLHAHRGRENLVIYSAQRGEILYTIQAAYKAVLEARGEHVKEGLSYVQVDKSTIAQYCK